MIFQLFRRKPLPEVTPLEARQRQQNGATILDVRELDEWQAGHIPGAWHIPLGQLPHRLHELDPNREWIVVCRSGSRSARATALLRQAGLQATNLAGGLLAWQQHRLPVTRER